MKKIENKQQYNRAVERVEQLLLLVDEDTPINDPAFIELKELSNLVANYSDANYSIDEPSPSDI